MSASDTWVISGDEVLRLIDPAQARVIVRAAMQTVSRGQAQLPLRIGAPSADQRAVYVAMPGSLASPRTGGVKVLSVRLPGHGGSGPSHQGVVVIFDPDSGRPQAIVDAHAVTLLRTAAATAVATEALARADSAILAVLGTGEQARAHLAALPAVRPIHSIRLWGRHQERANALAQSAAATLTARIDVVATAEAAVDGADIVTTLTGSTEPVLQGRWLARGCHVNLVGASGAHAREADDEVVRRSRFYVDYRASALAQAGELIHALGERAPDFIVGEIGAVLNGSVPGRRSPEELTVYKSLGIAAQDLALAHAAATSARAAGLGTQVRL